MDVEVLAVLVLLNPALRGFSIPIVSSVLAYRKRKELMQLHHEERMAAIERGRRRVCLCSNRCRCGVPDRLRAKVAGPLTPDPCHEVPSSWVP